MSNQTTESDAMVVAKKVVKWTSKELAYQAGVHAAAYTILIGVGYTIHKVQEYRRNKAQAEQAISTP